MLHQKGAPILAKRTELVKTVRFGGKPESQSQKFPEQLAKTAGCDYT